MLVAVSIHPLGALVQEIAGTDAEVLVLLPPGASPHSFEPTPRAVADGSRAAVVIRVGAGLDDWAAPIVRDALRSGAPELTAAALLDSLLPAQSQDELLEDEPARASHATSAEAQSAGGQLNDPHVWLDPINMERLCGPIGEVLAQRDPEHAAAYRSRANVCRDSLTALDHQLRAWFQPVRGIPFVATHNAWSYLCRRYGLRQAEVVQAIATREPGPRRMVKIMEAAAKVGARAVFTEVQVSNASAMTLASELGLRIAMLDPQGTPDDPARNRYFDLMRWNATRIVAALKPEPDQEPAKGPAPEPAPASEPGSPR